MSRVDLFLNLGLDVETAVILDDELSRLPPRTQRVFELRAAGYTQGQIAESIGVSQKTVSMHCEKFKKTYSEGIFWAKSRTYY